MKVYRKINHIRVVHLTREGWKLKSYRLRRTIHFDEVKTEQSPRFCTRLTICDRRGNIELLLLCASPVVVAPGCSGPPPLPPPPL